MPPGVFLSSLRFLSEGLYELKLKLKIIAHAHIVMKVNIGKGGFNSLIWEANIQRDLVTILQIPIAVALLFAGNILSSL